MAVKPTYGAGRAGRTRARLEGHWARGVETPQTAPTARASNVAPSGKLYTLGLSDPVKDFRNARGTFGREYESYSQDRLLALHGRVYEGIRRDEKGLKEAVRARPSYAPGPTRTERGYEASIRQEKRRLNYLAMIYNARLLGRALPE